ncbi:MAG: FecR domain-containing protein [Fuerstiella sp.]
MISEEEYNELMAAYLEGQLSEDQVGGLHALVHSSDELRQRFQADTRTHVLLRETLVEQAELQLLQDSVAAPRPIQSLQRSSVLKISAAILLVAAGIGLLFWQSPSAETIGVCVNVSGSSNLSIERETEISRLMPETMLRTGDTIQCGADVRAMLRLTDGSILSMESDSAVTLVSSRPEIRLDRGEVMFEIAKRNEGALPFRVQTVESTVDVMGTVFGLADDGHTKLEVYEGKVTLTRHRDNATVEVGSQQTASTATEQLSVQELSQASRRIIQLVPDDDATLDQGLTEAKQPRLKVEGDRRIVYLKFVIPKINGLQSAKLRLTQDIDAGSGTLRFFIGEHTDWSEDSLRRQNAPGRTREVARYVGVVGRGQSVEVDIVEAIKSAGPVTLIVTLDETDENDIWFSSREGNNPPLLILTQ